MRLLARLAADPAALALLVMIGALVVVIGWIIVSSITI
jgi:diacylglycerol kinase